MLKPYRTVQDVLSSPWAQVQRAKSSSQQTDRVLRSTKLEDSIYRDLRMEDNRSFLKLIITCVILSFTVRVRQWPLGSCQ